MMINLTIDNIFVTVPEGTTILDAAESAGLKIPTLCYLKGICDIGACRVCSVEIAGSDKLSAACNTVVQEGMAVSVNSPRALSARRVNTELILSAHNSDCPSCVRNKNCSLQSLAQSLNIPQTSYAKKVTKSTWPKEAALIRDNSKCISCGRCIAICDKVQSLGVWDILGGALNQEINVSGGKNIFESDCVLCGQCVTHCPVGALKERDDTLQVLDALADPKKKVLVQIAPAVRTAWGEDLGLKSDEATVGKMVDAVRKLGADFVFDTCFSADLTIMEEGSELLEVLSSGKNKLPMFTSCCPAWVSFIKKQYPELAPQLSTAKSPQQMFGAAAKSWFAKRSGIDPQEIYCVSIMPCMAKKREAVLDGMDSAKTGRDVDAVLTTRELVRLIKMAGINISELKDAEFDSPLGDGSGAGVIFGATGGVMEAALRSAYFLVTGKNPDASAFTAVRAKDGEIGLREVSVDIAGSLVRAAVVSGLHNAKALLKRIQDGSAAYDFVEVMACPGGCSGGGGQPIKDGCELAIKRAGVLYQLDEKAPLRFSHENPSVNKAYEEYYDKPLSHRAHEELHVKQY